MLRLKNQIVAALDVGSATVRALIAEVDENQQPVIKGFGAAPSKGIKKGLVIDVEEATQAIFNAVTAAEKMANMTINSCYVNLSGDHIRSMNTRGLVAVARDSRTGLGEAREIEQEDIERVIEHTKALPFPVDRQILHVLAQEFIVDDHGGIKNPLGLIGRRLEAKVHIVSYGTTAVSNLSKCIKNAELEIDGFVISSVAASYACLEESEKEMGTILLDIGSGVVDVIVFHDSGVHHTGVVNEGAASVTSDIAYMLRIPLEKAEQIKKEHGYARISLTDQEAFFKLNGLGGRAVREISRYNLAEWIEPRMEEILQEAYQEAQKSDIPLTNTLSVVLCGGGALLKGTEQLVESIFNTPARIGLPTGFSGYEGELTDPSFAVAIGLLKYAIAEMEYNPRHRIKSHGPFSNLRAWFKHIIENVM